MKLFINVFQNIVNNCFIVVVVVVYLKMWGFPWQSMQITYLGSAKSLKNNTYSTKVLMNGFRFWNAVSVGCQIVLLKLCCCMKSMIYFEFAQKWTCSLSCRKILNHLKYQTFLFNSDLDSFIRGLASPRTNLCLTVLKKILLPGLKSFLD